VADSRLGYLCPEMFLTDWGTKVAEALFCEKEVSIAFLRRLKRVVAPTVPPPLTEEVFYEDL
jgi:hypothetical protein